MVIKELLPIMPTDLQIINLFTDQATVMIQDEIQIFYIQNKDSLGYKDMLTLLSFADQQKYELSRYGVDINYINNFYVELLKQYTSISKVCCVLNTPCIHTHNLLFLLLFISVHHDRRHCRIIHIHTYICI